MENPRGDFWLTSNVPFREPLSLDRLGRILREEEPPGAWRPHLRAFFEDCPVSQVLDALEGANVPLERARAYYLTNVRPAGAVAEMEDLFGLVSPL